MEKSRIRIIIHGFVQGVTFRYQTLKKAKELNLKGWVRNNPDETVEIVAERNKEELEALLKWCQIGPKFAKVREIRYIWSEFKNEFKDFEIL